MFRTYNSLPAKLSGMQGSLAGNWRHNYDMRLLLQGSDVYTVRASGQAAKFSPVGAAYQSAEDRVFILTRLRTSATPAAWSLTVGDRSMETYDASGRLLLITGRYGLRQSMVYNSSGQLATITDPFGRTLALAYDASGRLAFGLADNGFRDYNPALGRYMQADPIGMEGGTNAYSYVGAIH